MAFKFDVVTLFPEMFDAITSVVEGKIFICKEIQENLDKILYTYITYISVYLGEKYKIYY